MAEKPETEAEPTERLESEGIAGPDGFSLGPITDSFGDAPSGAGHPGGGIPGGGMPGVSGVQEARPLYRINPPPEYPRVARRRGFQGTVVLEVLVDANGRVEDLRIFKSSGYNALDKAAITALKKWIFEPGIKDRRKVAMWVRVPVRFELE